MRGRDVRRPVRPGAARIGAARIGAALTQRRVIDHGVVCSAGCPGF
jgi:hypothetical protein